MRIYAIRLKLDQDDFVRDIEGYILVFNSKEEAQLTIDSDKLEAKVAIFESIEEYKERTGK